MTDTNMVAQPQEMTKETLDKAVEVLRQLPPDEERPDHINAGKDYWEHLKAVPPMPMPPIGVLGGFMGFNFFLDETLPPDVLEVRNKAGKVLHAFKLEA